MVLSLIVIGWLFSANQRCDIQALDGKQITAKAHFEDILQNGIAWTGTLVIDEGPLRNIKFVGAGFSNESLGGTVTVSGTIHINGDKVTIQPMQTTP